MKYLNVWVLMAASFLPMMVIGQPHHTAGPSPAHEPPRQAGPEFILIPPPPLTEGEFGGEARLVRIGPTGSSVQVRIHSEPDGSLDHRSSQIIGAWAESVRIPVNAEDNTLTDLGRESRMVVSANGKMVATARVEIIDDEPPPVMSLIVPPRIEEGKPPVEGRITTNRAAAVDFKVKLVTDPPGQIMVPGEITMKAGQRSAAFRIGAVDDARNEGNRFIKIEASAGHRIRGVSRSILAVDNEWRFFSVKLPAGIDEGGKGKGSVSVGRALPSKLEVTLTTGNPSSLRLPSKVVIPAGKSSVEFAVSVPSDVKPEVDRRVAVTASAPGFARGSSSVLIRDDSLASIAISNVPELIKAGGTVTTQVQAYTLSRRPLSRFVGGITIDMIMADGEVLPLTHDAIASAFSPFNIWMPSNVSGMVKLSVRHTSGITANSPIFEILSEEAPDPYSEMSLPTNDIAWDPVRSRFYASVPSNGGANANRVVVIDPATREITGSVYIGQQPGQLALTSDASALYVVRQANGSISRIDLPGLTVGLTFPVGVHQDYGTLFAEDICTVSGQPNLLVISQYQKSTSVGHNGVAVYDNGVARAVKTPSDTACNRIEASADPTLFFGYNNETTEFGLRHLRLSADGMREETNHRDIVTGFKTDIQVDGNLLVATSGTVVEGASLRKLGTLGSTGPVRPDLRSGRIFVLDRENGTTPTHDKITAYDSAVFSAVRQYKLPTAVESPSALIRWGEAGLAFRDAAKIYLIHDQRLVPSDPPADLDVSVLASVEPVIAGQAFEYTVLVRNKGPNPAFGTVITASLSAHQALGMPSSTVGTPTKPDASTVMLTVGDVAPGAEILLSIPVTTLSPGLISCKAAATSKATDHDQANNSGIKMVSVGFQPGPDKIRTLHLTASSLVNDRDRGLLWAAIPSTVDAPMGKSVVSINPNNGVLSAPIPLGGEPYANSMALSGNGRYLYVGLSDAPEVARIDLESAAKTTIRIPLGTSQWGSGNFAQDIEVLDGDGTSFLIAGAGDQAAAVFDGAVRRTNRTRIYSANRVEPSGTPGVYIGYNSVTSGFDLTRLQISASGVSEIMNVGGVIRGFGVEIEAEAGWVLSSSGLLVDANTLKLKADLGMTGRPCLDVANKRAYLVFGKQLHTFDIIFGNSVGALTLPTTAIGDWAKQCVRWGTDGFAVLGPDKILVARWSQAAQGAPVMAATAAAVAPTGLEDSDHDGIADGLEWLLGTPPDRHNANPVTITGISSTSILAMNNERRVLSVKLPLRIDEGGKGRGSVSVGRALPSKLEVTLTTGNPSSLRLPSKVVIPAGRSSVEFAFSATWNAKPEVNRRVAVTASAPGFFKGSSSLLVRDYSLASIAIPVVPEFGRAGGTVTTQIQAYSLSRLPLHWFRGEIKIDMVMADGEVLPLTHDKITSAFSPFKIRMPSNVSGMVKLRARHTSGITANSPIFEILAKGAPDPYAEMSLPTNDIAWDPVRSRLYASVPSTGGTHANCVVVIDPVTRRITGSVYIDQQPGQLALTSDASALYVVRLGNGSISRIDLPALTVGLTFPVGVHQYHGKLFAEDICTVPGQPNLLVVSQKSKSAGHIGLAAYDNGVSRPFTTQNFLTCNRIESSADPTLFFGYNNKTSEHGLKRLRLSADGMSVETNNVDIVSGTDTDIRADGNLLVATTGTVVDGVSLRKLGTLGGMGPVCPDLKSGRIFMLRRGSSSLTAFHGITAYDSDLFSSIREYKLPSAVESPTGLIRWGEAGLAFRTASKIHLIHDNRLVPSGPPADLDVSIFAPVKPVSAGQAFNYTVLVSNKGPNPAYGTVITASLSAHQTLGKPSSTVGTPTMPDASTVMLTVGDVAPGAEILLTIPATPLSPGLISCKASASSKATDPDQANNSGAKIISVGFQSGPDKIGTIRLTASGLVHDSVRGLLWAAIPSTENAPLGKSVVSIDPNSGVLSDPISIGGEPYANSMALSGNGRYLYVALSDAPEVVRIDLESDARSTVRIPLGTSQWGGENFAQDIEVLDGDGTSFLISGDGDEAAAVFDGAKRRLVRTDIYSVSRVEPSGTPGVYIGYNSRSSSHDLTRLQVGAAGVYETQNIRNVISGSNVEIEAGAGWVLSSSGLLVNANTLTLEANLGLSGCPCLDVANKRAYLVNGKQLRAFDIIYGESVGDLTLPTTATGNWARQCVRWGDDGFAVRGPDTIFIARWSQAAQGAPVMAATAAAVAPTGLEDSDGDGLADGLEWLFGTPQDRYNSNPVTIAGVSSASPHAIHVAFPRRIGVVPGSYGFETSADLRTWIPAKGVVESVTGTASSDGATVELINAAVPVEPGPSRFVRIRWNP